MSDIALRIKEIRKQKKLNQVEFAKALGVTSASISYYENGKRHPDFAFLNAIKNVFNVNVNWLLTGEGSMFREAELIELKDKDFIRLPVVANIAAGTPLEVFEDQVPSEYIDVPKSMLNLPPPYFVFKVDGDSMAPDIQPGDYVILSQDWRGINLDGRICGFRTPDGITLKKVKFQPKEQITWLIPLNHLKYDPIPYTGDTDDLVLFGVMITLIRKY